MLELPTAWGGSLTERGLGTSMDEKQLPRSRIKFALPIRVQGLSSDNKFFDEPAETPEAGPTAAELAGAGLIMKRKPYIESRRKGRAPLETGIKVIRAHYGTILEDICKTVNVSRQGACFLTKEAYAVGERVSVVLHYKEGDEGMPVPAYVVRVEPPKDGVHNAVAVRLEAERR
jgi:hypothetical protein